MRGSRLQNEGAAARSPHQILPLSFQISADARAPRWEEEELPQPLPFPLSTPQLTKWLSLHELPPDLEFPPETRWQPALVPELC